ncbi:MAG: Rrf2 family transcriptional regulator [Anaerolineales bacterium]|nr:Rrf2 family transcriptional regulator [Anaerolineales bacterium]
MQITRQADYAMRAIYYLSMIGMENRASTSQIAKEQNIPPSFLAKIISQLAVAGLLHTSRGARGGVMLARKPQDITMLDVIEAIDGPILLNECVADAHGCKFDKDCPMRSMWCEIQDDLVTRLGGTTFADFINKE